MASPSVAAVREHHRSGRRRAQWLLPADDFSNYVTVVSKNRRGDSSAACLAPRRVQNDKVRILRVAGAARMSTENSKAAGRHELRRDLDVP
jgi:hypothetical protein